MGWLGFSVLSLSANPTGGNVVAGAANIGSAGPTLTISQSSNRAIINWQSFSIGSGETTKFFVPNSSSATLNRVTGGNPSAIYGTLSSNGQLFLLNPNGILVGPGGRIDTAGFLGSTLSLADDEFLKGGNLHFSGSSGAAVDNQGTIAATGGDVYLIANQVSNEGTLTSLQGNTGLAAGSSVLYQQAGDQHLFVQPNPNGTTRAVGVTNAGTIQAATAELRAAGGNAYALAINNTGSIAASGYKKINGQVYLTADTGTIANSGTIRATGKSKGGTIQLLSQSGTITNSGKINVSATAAKGKGGSVLLQSTNGLAVNTGEIDAKGGTGGAGGLVELSGDTVHPDGLVNTLAFQGTTGLFIIDPNTYTVAASGGDDTGVHVGQMLGTSDVQLQASQNIFINDAINWSSAHSLTLTTTATGSAVTINSAISAANGTLVLDAKDSSGQITTGANGAVAVKNFTLQNGTWTQVASTLPAFSATNDFEIQNGSTFLRASGGSGTSGNPYQITDVYGLQGLASAALVSTNAVLANNINAAGTTTWNSGAGFVPIGTYNGADSNSAVAFHGSFDGQGHTISNLYIHNSTLNSAGLFGDAASDATLANVNLTSASINGHDNIGGLVGISNGTITNSSVAGTVSGINKIGGLVGTNSGSVDGSSSSGTVTVNGNGTDVGGLVGSNQGGTISNSSSAATLTGNGSASNIGGFVGFNIGAINASSSTGSVTVNNGTDVGGFIGLNSGGTITNSSAQGAVHGLTAVGGFAGSTSGGSISISYSRGATTGTTLAGGFAGSVTTTALADNYYSTDGSGLGTGIGNNSGGTITYDGVTAASLTGLTLAQMKNAVSYSGAWDFSSVWTTNGNTTLPQLLLASAATDTISGTAYSNGGITIAPGVTLTLIFAGNVLNTTTTDSQGNYSFTLTATDLGTGILLTDATNKGNTFFQTNNTSVSVTGLNLFGSTLRVIADSASNASLKTVIGSLTGNGINYSVTGNNLSTQAGIGMNILSNYQVDGNITATGVLSISPTATLTGSTNSTLQGSTVNVSGAFDRTGSLTFTSTAGQVLLVNVGSSGSPSVVHGLTLNGAGPVLLQNCYLTLGGGNFSATGTGYTSLTDAAGEANGVNLFNTTILGQGGNLSLNGTAGYVNNNGTLEAGLGVAVGSDGSTPAELSTTSTGTITITGTSNHNFDSATYFAGVDIYADGVTPGVNVITTQDGAINITGTILQGRASGTGANNSSLSGVQIQTSAVVAATGTGAVTLSGNTAGATSQANGAASAYNLGVLVQGAVSTAGGNLTLQGTSGTVNTSNSTVIGDGPASIGVSLADGSSVSTGDGATVNLTGTAGTVITTGAHTGSSIGVNVATTATATFANNVMLSINGTGGAVNAGTGANSGDAISKGINLDGTVALGTGGSGTLTGTGGALQASQTTSATDANVPVTEGIAVRSGNLSATGTTALTLDGTGGAVTSGTNKAVGSIGVNIGGNQTTTGVVSTGSGLLTVTGHAGSTPSLGIGVVVHGFNGALGEVSSGTGNIVINGTGGSGYLGTGDIVGNYAPNGGVAILDHAILSALGGNITINGRGGAKSNGVTVLDLKTNTALDRTPVASQITAGQALNITSTSGGIVLDGEASAASTTITSPGLLAIADSSGGTALNTGTLTASATGAIDLLGTIATNGTASISSTDGDIVVGPNGSISDTGAGHNLILAAGTDLPHSHYFINHSSAGSGAVQATNGAQFFIFSADPTNDVFNGVTVPANNRVFGAQFPGNNLPNGNGELFYVANATSTGPNGPGGGNNGGGGGNPLPPSTTPENSGSNVVPPAVVPQFGNLQPPPFGGGLNGGSVEPALPTSGAFGTGGAGGLAGSSGNGGQVGAGDAAQLGNGALNNVQNPAAANALDFALGAPVHNNLIAALTALGDFTPPASTDNDDSRTAENGETLLNDGDVVEIGGGTVKTIPLSKAPKSLQNALGNGVRDHLPGH